MYSNIVLGTNIKRVQIDLSKNHSHRKNREEKRIKSQTTFIWFRNIRNWSDIPDATLFKYVGGTIHITR